MTQAISKITIKGFKSIRCIEDFELRNINILIGPNGSGKSNFLSFAELLKAALSEKNEIHIRRLGTANRLFYMGSKITKTCEFEVRFTGGITGFHLSISLTANPEDELIDEIVLNPEKPSTFSGKTTGARDDLAYLKNAQQNIQKNIGVYHFHDTSTFADI